MPRVTDAGLAGMFAPSAVRDWPQGVQEPDVPRFAVEHLDALRPAPSGVGETSRLPAHISRRAI